MLLSLCTLAALAQTTAAVSTTSFKSKEEIMDAYNTRTGVNLKLYPNPASNYLIIEPELQTEACEIRIMDITGALKTALHLEAGSNSVYVDVSTYPTGLYVLALYNSNNHLLHIKRFNKGA